MKKIILIIATVAIVATASWAGNSLLLLGVGGGGSDTAIADGTYLMFGTDNLTFGSDKLTF